MRNIGAGTNSKRTKNRTAPIHHSIKRRLGYAVDESDAEVLKDWKARLSRVCKPCWELKYCPYGPLVEEYPLLPIEREHSIQHVDYIRNCLKTGYVGEVREMDELTRQAYEGLLVDDDLLLEQLLREYRVRHEPGVDVDLAYLPKAERRLVRRRLAARKRELRDALKAGVVDSRAPLSEPLRKRFREQVSSFNPDDDPESIPKVFRDGQCNIFGHICPVFFAAEAISETSTSRRRGRYIPFATKVRVVRRDNYTCQHCGTHLRDDAVEFDHKIPLSKGGSSEEHNVRLTCFDCNRDKQDRVEI